MLGVGCYLLVACLVFWEWNIRTFTLGKEHWYLAIPIAVIFGGSIYIISIKLQKKEKGFENNICWKNKKNR